MISLSIVIVNYKSWLPLTECLDSLLIQKNINPKIIVVDNDSQDNDELNKFESKYNSIVWKRNEKNFGFSKACNIGAKLATSKWILFLNPDTIIPKDCLIKLMNKVEPLENQIIGIKQINNEGKDTYAYGNFLNWYTINGIFRFFYRMLKNISKNKLKKKEFFSPDWISGSFVLLQKKDFDEIGGWDEDFFMYYEDMDICKRARILNIKTKFYNSIFCYHMHGKSSRFDYDIKVNSKAQVIKSSHIYIKKHYKGLSGNIISLILYMSQATELLILSIFIKEKRDILKKILGN